MNLTFCRNLYLLVTFNSTGLNYQLLPTYMQHTHLLHVELLLSTQDEDEIVQLRLREGVPLDGAVGVVTENQLAVSVGDARLQRYHQGIIILKQSPT